MNYKTALLIFCVTLILIGCSPQNGIKESGGVEKPSPEETTETIKKTSQEGTSLKEYAAKNSFFIFKDPNENAFTVEIPKGWQVTQGSGLVRPYIDAGVYLEAKSQNNQGIYYSSPYGYVYATPNAILEFAGFIEGSLYNPSGGISKPMMVKKYTGAKEYVTSLPKEFGIDAEIKEVIERPDLLNKNPLPLITQQSAAEIIFIDKNKGIKHNGIAYAYLVEASGTGVWAASYFDYYAPENLFDETELLALKVKESFKVNPQWAAREAQEVAKRTQIISQTQEEVSNTISSTFGYRSKTMDDLADKWSKRTLEVEDVYDTDTGEHYTVDSGSKYYWINDKNQIVGTDTEEPPSYRENFRQMKCPECLE